MKERVHSRVRTHVVLVTVLAVLAAAALVGALVFAPAAAAAPDASQLDAFLAQHASPMTGTGATFIREGQEHGVDPVFLVAIAGAETSFGAVPLLRERRPVHVQRLQLVLRPHVADQ